MFSEDIPSILDGDSLILGELYYLTKDKTDYAWYTTSIKIEDDDIPDQKGQKTILRVAGLGHALIVYVNGEYASNAHGSHEMKDSGSYMEHTYAGPRGVSIIGLKSGTRDLIENNEWGHLVYIEEGSKKVKWEKYGEHKPLTWYKTYFETPEGENAVAIRMKGMGKGLIWVHGIGVGRYWMSFVSPLGEPIQTEYHIPRSFMKEEKKKSMFVILEEEPVAKMCNRLGYECHNVSTLKRERFHRQSSRTKVVLTRRKRGLESFPCDGPGRGGTCDISIGYVEASESIDAKFRSVCNRLTGLQYFRYKSDASWNTNLDVIFKQCLEIPLIPYYKGGIIV
ncbi:predicted protein [Arabidopsis lyrata subsp. lyrata]|uniref:beta-galactosidase n=1 Tax=Arabidopsis lyrata subsp. lyrata TaxID=81972 RepID=D7L7E8_ARALL|nr:predicted protein [Arabidopsis lyrata subsp. lyrata]